MSANLSQVQMSAVNLTGFTTDRCCHFVGGFNQVDISEVIKIIDKMPVLFFWGCYYSQNMYPAVWWVAVWWRSRRQAVAAWETAHASHRWTNLPVDSWRHQRPRWHWRVQVTHYYYCYCHCCYYYYYYYYDYYYFCYYYYYRTVRMPTDWIDNHVTRPSDG